MAFIQVLFEEPNPYQNGRIVGARWGSICCARARR